MSKCFPGRKRHRFRHPRTMGPLNVKLHGDMECWWCKKTYRQVIAEQRSARKMKKMEEVDIPGRNVSDPKGKGE